MAEQFDDSLQKIIGIHSVEKLIREGGFLTGDTLFLARREDGRVKELLYKAKRASVNVKRVSPGRLSEMVQEANHQGIALFRKSKNLYPEMNRNDMEAPGLYVAAEGVQDPGNLGAIVRSMAAFGARGLVIPRRKSAPAGETVLKASAGALLSMPVMHVGGIPNFLHQAHEDGFYIVGTALGGDELSPDVTQDICSQNDRILLVLGTEQTGLSPLAQKRCDRLLQIGHSDSVNSLNVSAAAAIFLYELSRSLS